MLTRLDSRSQNKAVQWEGRRVTADAVLPFAMVKLWGETRGNGVPRPFFLAGERRSPSLHDHIGWTLGYATIPRGH